MYCLLQLTEYDNGCGSVDKDSRYEYASASVTFGKVMITDVPLPNQEV